MNIKKLNLSSQSSNQINPFNLKEYMFYNLFLSFYVDNKSKFEYLIKMEENMFLSAENKKLFLDIFFKIQKTIFYLNYFVRKYKYKKTEIKVDTDLFLNKINETQYNVITIYQDNCKYLFTVSDLLHIIKNSICNTDDFYPDPVPCKNPYNNIPFNKSSLLNIYFFVKNRNYVMPDYLHNYFLVYFNLYEFKVNNENIIANHAIKMYINNNSVITLYNKISEMIIYYNKNKYYSRGNKKIEVDIDFPKQKLIEVFKNYLNVYLKMKYYPDVNFKKNKNELVNKLGVFSQNNPTFGRKILVLDKKGKIKSFYFDEKYKNINVYNNEDQTHISEINPYRTNRNAFLENFIAVQNVIGDTRDDTLGYNSDHEYYDNTNSDNSDNESVDNSDQEDQFNNLSIRLDNLERELGLLNNFNSQIGTQTELNTNIFSGTHIRFDEEY
jgi:hypothetical protein